jgi:hypothetical protein
MCFAQETNISIWAVDETEKIRRDDIHSSLRFDKRNRVWNNSRVELFGAKNEIVGFQLLLQTDSIQVESITVSLDSLTSDQYTIRNSKIKSTNVFDYRGKCIEIFVAHYINVDTPTSHPSLWWTNAAPSSYYTGPIPDALIPIEAMCQKNPSGISIAPFNTQALWFDIYIPASAKAGLYRGDLNVMIKGMKYRTIPLALHVFGFSLSDTTHFKNFFVTDNKGIKYKHNVEYYSPEYYSIEMKYHQHAHRHRMNLAFMMPLESLIVHHSGYFTGEYFNEKYYYQGPGESVGIDVYPIGVYDQPHNGWRSGFLPATRQGWQNAAIKWLRWFVQYSPETLLLRYMIDEPESTQYSIIRERSNWLQSVSYKEKKIYSLVTTYKIDHRLFGAVDYWGLTAQSGYDQGDGIPIGYMRKKVLQRKEKGEKIVLYNGTRPSSSCPHIIDTDASDSRVVPWIGWKYGIDLYFLWNTNLFYYGSRRMNPFVDNFTNLDNMKQWGNGTFFYPGESHDYPENDYDLGGPISSIRMKNWRRGQQDYEYLHQARLLNLGNIIDSLVNSIVPAAFDDVTNSQNSQIQWEIRGFEYEKVRRILAERIESSLNLKKH